MGSGAKDGVQNHLWGAFQIAVQSWFGQKVEEVLGLGMTVWNVLNQGGIKVAEVGAMAWEGIKSAIPPTLIQLLIEKVVSMIIPAAGTVMLIIQGLQAAWGTVGRILQAMEKFVTFLKAVKSGQSGPQFAEMLAAAGVVLIDFVSNWLLKRLRGAASKVAAKVREIAKKIGRKLKKGLKRLKRKLGKVKDKFFGKKGDKVKGREGDRNKKNNKAKDGKPDEQNETIAEKQKRVDDAVAAAVSAVNSTFGGKEVSQAKLAPILRSIKRKHKLQTLQANKEGNKWEIYGKVNPDRRSITTGLVGKEVAADEAQARVETKNAIDKVNTLLTRKYRLNQQRQLVNSSAELLESIRTSLKSIKIEFNRAAVLKDSKQAVQELKQVKNSAEDLGKWIQGSLKEKTSNESQKETDQQNNKPDKQGIKGKGWKEDEKIETQLASRGQLSALNRIPGGSLSPLSSQDVRGLTPNGLKARLQEMVESGQIDKKRKDKILRTVRKFFEDRDLTHGK
ncbi:hypothetical protein Cylst_2293 [Cylindrospermum stagnale PCC 7417]|uniref:Uncharacterized protein n=1 Tax=Cylindrospermum stagnale PCC 7417 TaxID=56107 RepID=K9WWC8_9NOST|nr:hypothetical protein Cylst_2293 [Cylindrospermum stagnale PCC 7417]